jgi:hypothetical protein
MNRRFLPIAILGIAAATASYAAVPTQLFGEEVPPDQADRTIRIEPGTRYVNVNYGESVRFEVNGSEFAFRFDGAEGETALDLRQVAPAGTLDHRVEAYIGPDPDKAGG